MLVRERQEIAPEEVLGSVDDDGQAWGQFLVDLRCVPVLLARIQMVAVEETVKGTDSQYLSSFCVSLLSSTSSSNRASEPGDGVSTVRTSCGEADESVSQNRWGGWLRYVALPMLDRGLDLNSRDSPGLTVALYWSPGVESGLEAGRTSGAGAGACAGSAPTTPPASCVASSQN